MIRPFLIFILSIVFVYTAEAQYKMDVSATYNIPFSADFKNDFNNGYGVNAEFHYFIKKTGFSASLLVGLNGFRAKQAVEDALIDTSLIFDYDYRVDYYVFPVFLKANYTFFMEKKFNIIVGMGIGGLFMEKKEKQTGEYTSDTNKEKFNEFGIYPSLGISYAVSPNISVILNSGFNMSFGKQELQYIDIRAGLIYEI